LISEAIDYLSRPLAAASVRHVFEIHDDPCDLADRISEDVWIRADSGGSHHMAQRLLELPFKVSIGF